MTNYQRPMTRPCLPVIWIIFAHRWTVFDNRHCSKPNRFSLSLQELIASSLISCIIYIWSDCKRNVSQLHPFTLVTEGYMGWVRSLVSVTRWIPIAIAIGSSPAVMLSRLEPSLCPSLQPLLLPKLSRLANRPLSLSPALQYCKSYFILFRDKNWGFESSFFATTTPHSWRCDFRLLSNRFSLSTAKFSKYLNRFSWFLF